MRYSTCAISSAMVSKEPRITCSVMGSISAGASCTATAFAMLFI
ncbi:hypothetical protein [Aquamicrobium terrae]